MKKFLKTYFSNDGAGIFAVLWFIGIVAVITLLVVAGGTK